MLCRKCHNGPKCEALLTRNFALPRLGSLIKILSCAMTALGQQHALPRRSSNGRFTSMSRHLPRALVGRISAISGPRADAATRVSGNPTYSIISSARIIRNRDTSSPRALAVFRLMTSSTFVACWNGRLTGFSPLRICPV
jgi:hypothetical protein